MPTRVNLVPNNTGSSGVGSTVGTEAKKWNNIYSRTGSIDQISSSNGTTDVLANLLVRGDAEVRGNLTFGNADTDSVSFGAEISSSIVPDADGSYNLGSSTKRWKELHVDNVFSDGFTSGSKHLFPAAGGYIFETGSANQISMIGGTKAIAFYSGSTGQVSFDFTSNDNKPLVGIGTGAPTKTLQVEGDISASGDILLDEDQRIYFEADKQTWIEANGANLFRIVANNNQMLLLDHETGNRAVFGNGAKVFIGDNNNALPDKELEVVGDISASGDLSATNITASGNINGSSTSTGSLGHLIIGGSNIETFISSSAATSGFGSIGVEDPSFTGNVTTQGTNPYFLAQESSTEFLRMGAELTSGDMHIGWDDSDDLHLGVLSSPTDTTITTKMLIKSTGAVVVGGDDFVSPAVGTNLVVSGAISASSNLTVGGDITGASGSFGNTIVTGEVKVTGSNPYFLAQESSTEFIKMGVEQTSGDMMIGWDHTDDLHIGLLTTPGDETIATKMLVKSTGAVVVGGDDFASPAVDIGLTVSSSISASGDIMATDITGSKAMFTALPGLPSLVGTGELYTQSGSQLPFETGSYGSTNRTQWDAITGSKFVLIK